MTKTIEELAIAPAVERVWIVVWVTRDDTARPYYCGVINVGTEGEEHAWSARAEDAQPFASWLAARLDPELEDYWDAGDIECRRQ